MRVLENPFRGKGLPAVEGLAGVRISMDIETARALYARYPAAKPTPLLSLKTLASDLGIVSLDAKDERRRMGLRGFEALGAAYALARESAAAGGDPATSLAGRTYACASGGDHAISLAAGARWFGAAAIVYLPRTAPEGLAERLRSEGATVLRAGADHGESLATATEEADKRGWRLVPDGSREGNALAGDGMEGYLVMGDEAARQIARPPTHVFLQADTPGGGLAVAGAIMARRAWGEGVRIVIVEPQAAPTLFDGIGSAARGGTDAALHPALGPLAREADAFVLVSDREAQDAAARLGDTQMAATPSGARGFAGLCGMTRPTMRALVYISEDTDP